MLIAEDLLLLVFDDETGKPAWRVGNPDTLVAGAVLLELSMLGRVGVTGQGEVVYEGKAGRLTVDDASPTGSPVLDAGLEKLAKLQGRKPKDVVSPLTNGKLTELVLTGLADRGLMRREDNKVLGLFPVTRWPAEDSAHETELRASLARVLIDGEDADERTGAVVSLLAATSAASKVLTLPEGVTARQIDKRAKEVAENGWASDAVKNAVEEITAALIVAMMVPLFVATAAT